jgi:hypothetical protein
MATELPTTPPPLLLPADDDVPIVPAAPWPDLTPLASAQARRAERQQLAHLGEGKRS